MVYCLHHVQRSRFSGEFELFAAAIHLHFLTMRIHSFFSSFKERDFARGGMDAEEDVVIPAGPLPFQHTMVDQLRKLGLPVMLKNGTPYSYS